MLRIAAALAASLVFWWFAVPNLPADPLQALPMSATSAGLVAALTVFLATWGLFSLAARRSGRRSRLGGAVAGAVVGLAIGAAGTGGARGDGTGRHNRASAICNLSATPRDRLPRTWSAGGARENRTCLSAVAHRAGAGRTGGRGRRTAATAHRLGAGRSGWRSGDAHLHRHGRCGRKR